MKTVHLNPVEFGKTSLEEFEGMTLINLLEQEFQGKKFVLLTFWDETTGEFKKLQIWDDGELQTTEVYCLSNPSISWQTKKRRYGSVGQTVSNN